MTTVTQVTHIEGTTYTATLEDGREMVITTDIPLESMTLEEQEFGFEAITNLIHRIKEAVKAVIEDDSYIKVQMNTVSITPKDSHISLVYPEGAFGTISALFYFDWLSSGDLLEVLQKDDLDPTKESMALLTYLQK